MRLFISGTISPFYFEQFTWTITEQQNLHSISTIRKRLLECFNEFCVLYFVLGFHPSFGLPLCWLFLTPSVTGRRALQVASFNFENRNLGAGQRNGYTHNICSGVLYFRESIKLSTSTYYFWWVAKKMLHIAGTYISLCPHVSTFKPELWEA